MKFVSCVDENGETELINLSHVVLAYIRSDRDKQDWVLTDDGKWHYCQSRNGVFDTFLGSIMEV